MNNSISAKFYAVFLSLVVICHSSQAIPATGGELSILAKIPSGGYVQNIFEGADGNLYGTFRLYNNDYYSGNISRVSLFRVDATTGAFTNLVTLSDVSAGYYYYDNTAFFRGAGASMYGSYLERTTNFVTNSDSFGGFWTNTSTSDVRKIFRLDTNGAFSTLATITNPAYPSAAFAGLLQATDGHLYWIGSTNVVTNSSDSGVPTPAVFRLKTNGEISSLAVLINAAGFYNSGYNQLLQGPDGFLYASTSANYNTSRLVFRVGTNSQWSVLATLTNPLGKVYVGQLLRGVDGVYLTEAERFVRLDSGAPVTVASGPEIAKMGAPFQAADKNFYGSLDRYRYWSGYTDFGSVSRLATNNGEVKTLATFMGSNGVDPNSLFQGLDGSLYGATSEGGDGYFGTIFRVTTDGDFRTLASFNGTNGAYPSSLFQGSDGQLYGTASSAPDGQALIFKLKPTYDATPAPTPKPKPQFPGQITTLLKTTDGYPSFVQGGADGNIYGVLSSSETGANSIFRLKSNGEYALLKALPENASVGNFFVGAGANMYGTYRQSFFRTVTNDDGYLSYTSVVTTNTHTLFGLDSKGQFENLATFSNVNLFSANLLRAADGSVYGCFSTNDVGSSVTTVSLFQWRTNGQIQTIPLTNASGHLDLANILQGTDGNLYCAVRLQQYITNTLLAFRVSPGGTVTALASLTSAFGNLFSGADGNVYLVKRENFGVGAAASLLRLDDNSLFTIQASLTNGFYPDFQGAEGNFYGLGNGEGSNAFAFGSVDRMLASGEVSTLATFRGPNGIGPQSLFQGKDGSLYGVAYEGGYSFYGTVFRVTTSGELTTLAEFEGTNGVNPDTLFQGADGNFYGTTETSAPYRSPTIFKLTLPTATPTPTPTATPTPTPTPTPAITEVKILPPKRTVSAGKPCKFMVMVSNNSTVPQEVTVVFEWGSATDVPVPTRVSFTVPGKKNDKQKAKSGRKSFSLSVPADAAAAKLQLKASAGGQSGTSTITIKPVTVKKPK